MYIVIYSFLSYITYTYLVDRISILSSFVGLESRHSLFLVLRISCILRTITNSYLLVLVLTLECVYNIFAPYCSLLAGPGSSYIIYHSKDDILNLYTAADSSRCPYSSQPPTTSLMPSHGISILQAT